MVDTHDVALRRHNSIKGTTYDGSIAIAAERSRGVERLTCAVIRPGVLDGCEIRRAQVIYLPNIDRATCGRPSTSCRPNGHACGESAQPEQVAKSHQRVKAPLLIQDAATTTNHGLAIAADIPRKPDSWREIVVIAIIDARESSNPDLLQSFDWVEVTHQVVFLFDDRIEFVAYPQIEGESRSDTPVILQEGCVPLVLQMPQQSPRCEPRPVHISGEEVLQGLGGGDTTF